MIGKANSSHPETTRLFAQEAAEAIKETGLPPATVQLIYRTSHKDGERLVRIHGVGFPGRIGERVPNSAAEFATFMRAVCATHGGTFVALSSR